MLLGGGDQTTVDAGVIVSIEAVSRNRSVFVHSGRVERGTLAVGDLVTARVDGACRRRAQANHTATHLLQAALKQVVDPGIGQAGSLVDFDRLRFDFHCPRAVTAEELERIEALINGWISEGHALVVEEMAIEQARAAGAVAMFGEKYARWCGRGCAGGVDGALRRHPRGQHRRDRGVQDRGRERRGGGASAASRRWRARRCSAICRSAMPW